MIQPLHHSRLPLTGDRSLSWCEFGTPGGRPLLYCHGMPGSRLEAAVLHELASARGVRVVCPERPGYGETTPLGPRRLGMETADIQALASYLELDRFDLLGFSGGGPHALAIAAALPERVGRLTLVSSWAPFDRSGLDAMAEELRELWTLGQSDFAAFSEALTGAVTGAGGAWAMMTASAPDADRALLESEPTRTVYRHNLDEATRQGCTGMLEDARALLTPWPFEPAAVRPPVRIFHGEADRNAPVVMGRWLAEAIDGAYYTEWPHALHFAAFERWEPILAEAIA